MTRARSKTRCVWCGSDPNYVAYHDDEWGVPLHDDQKLFEMLVLEGAQAGLSWITILRKRDAYRRAFAEFDPERVVRFGAAKQRSLLNDPGIVRNRAKIASAVRNARAFLAVQEEYGTFDRYQWRFVDGRPVQNRFEKLAQIPARTPISDAFSKDLKQRGFSFVGSTIVYAQTQIVLLTRYTQDRASEGARCQRCHGDRTGRRSALARAPRGPLHDLRAFAPAFARCAGCAL